MPAGLLITAVMSIVLAIGFDLNAIASIGSAVALVVFSLVTAGHIRVRSVMPVPLRSGGGHAAA